MATASEERNQGGLAFCVSARTGLGHLRRVTNIAEAIKARSPSLPLCLMTNAPPVALSAHEQALFSRIIIAERSRMARLLAAENPDVVVVDTAVIPELERLPQALAIILRETVPARLSAFRLPGDRLWDEALLAEPAHHWTIEPEAVGAAKITNVGWIYRTAPGGSPVLGAGNARRRLLVATGGGGGEADGRALLGEIDRVLVGLRAVCQTPMDIVQVVGPRAPADARLSQADRTIDVGSRLDLAFAEADAVVTSSGYNSILEIATTSTPALLCTIPRTYDDQVARAKLWGPRLGLDHDGTDADRSVRWLATILEHGDRRPPVDLGPPGCRQAADALIALVQSSQHANRRGLFFKAYNGRQPADRAEIARRSRILFSQDVPTLPGREGSSREVLTFAQINGPTARELYAADRTPDGRAHILGAVMNTLAALHRAPTLSLALPAFDPWLRVAPRLAPETTPASLMTPIRRQRLDTLIAQLTDTEGAAKAATGVVHGDLHLGQFIQPLGSSDFILIDHDDLAVGPAESDIANFIAHIVTTPHLAPCAGDGSGFEMLADECCAAYMRAAGRSLDTALLRHFAAIALIRRGLKCLERGDGLQAFDAAIDVAGRLADAQPFIAQQAARRGVKYAFGGRVL